MNIVDRAQQLGVLRPGWRFIDYCFEAAPLQKWICTIIWGEKGNLKSNLMLQHGYTVFHGFDEVRTFEGGMKEGRVTNWEDMDAWETVFEYLVFRPANYAQIITKALDEGKRLAWLGWDDINIHLPRSMYSTDRKTWENISKNWEGSRTSLSIFECTAPRKDKVVSFILADMAWDILCSGRDKEISNADYQRWMWDRDFYEPERINKASVKVEEEKVYQNCIPKDVWNRYWKLRTDVNSELQRGLVETMKEIDSPKPVHAGAGRTAVQCPDCHRFMNEYNLSIHKCKAKSDTTTPLKTIH